jgi:Sugar kinases, ribokinase family
MYDIAAIGESLIDFTPAGKSGLGQDLFSKNPGGAPANVLAMASILGLKTAFIGKVGNDAFGHFLRDTMVGAGIDCRNLVFDDERNTTLAFVTLDEKGDRSFSFYRDGAADVNLSNDEVDLSIAENARIFHFGSVSMTHEKSRCATLEAVKCAKKSGAIISYDPNYRPLLWKDSKKAVEVMGGALELADIVKVSDYEVELLSGREDPAFFFERGVKLLIVTRGAKGASAYTPYRSLTLPTYDVKTVDTTGAGDAFYGAFLTTLISECHISSGKDLVALDEKQLERLLKFSNAAGSLATMGYGAIPAMPRKKEIEACIASEKLLG